MNNKESIGQVNVINPAKELEVKDYVNVSYNNVDIKIIEVWENFTDSNNENTTFIIELNNPNTKANQVMHLIPESLMMLFAALGSIPKNKNNVEWYVAKSLTQELIIQGSYDV
jgi:hypothetical protein